jgi:predicted AAA+ superfamily ATPase
LIFLRIGSIRELNKPWAEVFDERLDEQMAPSLWEVYFGEAPKIYSDPFEFFKRTHYSPSIEDLIRRMLKGLKGEEGGSNVLTLYSLFGGGKTHTEIMIYHAFKNPIAFSILDPKLGKEIESIGRVRVVALDCDSIELVPNPFKPLNTVAYNVRTIWGALAHQLGKYGVLRDYDSEKSPVPTPDVLRKLLGEESAVILIDELVKHIYDLNRSRAIDYSDKILLFIQNLAKAVEGTKVVLIVTIPIQIKPSKGQQLIAAEEMFEREAHALWKVIGRVGAIPIEPIKVEDISEVLKKRIFEKICEENVRLEIQKKYFKMYGEYPEVFGKELHWSNLRIKDSYPYHPKYIEVLYELVSRSRDLQKTRDAIKITRKVVRSLWKKEIDANLIMPWHIDLTDPILKSTVITPSYRSYDAIVNRDILLDGRVRFSSRPELANKVATSIFLKTYTYEGTTKPEKPYPDSIEVALMVYEEHFFLKEKLKPTDISDVLQEMVGRHGLYFLLGVDERYWFTIFPTVTEIVDRKAEEILRTRTPELYEELTKTIKESVKGTISKREAKVEVKMFKPEKTIVIGYGEDIFVPEANEPTLVVLAKPEVDFDEAREVVFNVGENVRRNKNTIVVVYPDSEKDYRAYLLSPLAELKACDEVRQELGILFGDEDIRKMQEKTLRRNEDEANKTLLKGVLDIFIKIAYPTIDETGNFDVKEISATPYTSIIYQTEAALQGPEANKIPQKYKIGFEELNSFMNKIFNVNLKDGNKPLEFRYLLERFLDNPRCPLATKEMLQEAVKEGIRRLDVGVEQDGKVFWKKILMKEEVATILPIELEGYFPEDISIKEHATILPWKIAAEKLAKELLKEERIIEEEGSRRKIWFTIKLEDKEYSLKELLEKRDFDTVRAGLIIKYKEEIREGIILTLNPSFLECDPSQNINVDVTVEPVNLAASYEVRFEIDSGNIEPSKGILPLTSRWSIKAPDVSGEYSFKIRVVGLDEKHLETSTLMVRVKTKEVVGTIIVDELKEEHLGFELLEIFKFKDYNSFELIAGFVEAKPESIKSKVRFDQSFRVDSDSVEIKGSMDIVSTRMLLQDIGDSARKLGLETSVFDANLVLKDPIRVDLVMIYQLKPAKAKYKLRIVK